MRKAIKVLAYQNLVNYRKPQAIDIQESYPLPPYSTVIGMVHSACGFLEYHDMQVSIQGRSKTSISDMYTRYFFGMKYDESRHQHKVKRVGLDEYDGITRGLGYAQLYVDVELMLHIMPSSEEDLEVIYNGLKSPKCFLSLGRHEDLLRIDTVEIVDIFDTDEDDCVSLKFDAYIPLEVLNNVENSNIDGPNFILNKKFKKTKPDEIRRWEERVKAKYVPMEKGKELFGNIQYELDKESNKKYGVFFA